MEQKKLKQIVTFFILCWSLLANAQYLPKDDAKLNYNQIYFEYPYNVNAKLFKLILAYDSSQLKNDFNSYSILTKTDRTPATLVKDLQFGKKYKWYIETTLKSGETLKSEAHYFTLLNTSYNDTSLYKRKINYNHKSEIQDGIIWCDFSHCAFDRSGKLVWFMPTDNSEFKESSRVRDIRFQKDGTFTFIKNPGAMHANLDISSIWEAPLSGEHFEKFKNGYHHSMEKLPNGNYMLLAYDYVELEKTDAKDTLTNRVELVNLIEFNQYKEIVWIWEMRESFPLDILAVPKENDRGIINAHCNAFSVDKNNEFIFIGFRDISRIIKIDKKSKKIVAAYGKKLNDADSLVYPTTLFSYHHDTRVLNDNSIMVLNNNDFNAGQIASVEIFKQPKTKSDIIKPIWSFKFNFDTINNGKSLKLGNVKILDNGNYLINEGSSNRIVEITKNKKVLWDMMLYRKDKEKNKWVNFGSYRIDFSTSLYPYYFSAAITNNMVTIFNEGDFKDNYKIEVLNKDQLVIETIVSKKLIAPQELIHLKYQTLSNAAKSLKITSLQSEKEKKIMLN